jgi:hypothetical protein
MKGQCKYSKRNICELSDKICTGNAEDVDGTCEDYEESED